MTPRGVAVLIPFLLVASAIAHCIVKADATGCTVVSTHFRDVKRPFTVQAPHGANSVVIDRDNRVHIRRGNDLEKVVDLGNDGAGIYISWAPDSPRVFIGWSDAGSAGQYHVRVFEVRRSGIAELPTTVKAENEFAAKWNCDNNVRALRWLNGQELLVSTYTYPSTSCGEQAFKNDFFRVRAADGEILERLTEAQVASLRCGADAASIPSKM